MPVSIFNQGSHSPQLLCTGMLLLLLLFTQIYRSPSNNNSKFCYFENYLFVSDDDPLASVVESC